MVGGDGQEQPGSETAKLCLPLRDRTTLSLMARRAWDDFFWWLDGLSAFQAVGGYFLVSVLTGVLLAAVGRETVSYVPFIVAFGLFIIHCSRRAYGGWEVWGYGTGPGAVVALLTSIFGLKGAVAAVLAVAALLLSLLLAWCYDRAADRGEPVVSD